MPIKRLLNVCDCLAHRVCNKMSNVVLHTIIRNLITAVSVVDLNITLIILILWFLIG